MGPFVAMARVGPTQPDELAMGPGGVLAQSALPPLDDEVQNASAAYACCKNPVLYTPNIPAAKIPPNTIRSRIFTFVIIDFIITLYK